MLSLIGAHDKNYAIGYQGWMPWNLKDDLKQFKKRTLNHTIVMGLNTFKTLKKHLKDRHTIIVSHYPITDLLGDNVSFCHDFETFLIENCDTDEEIFICGGASIYQQALPYCKKLYISLVDGEWPADTWIMDYNPDNYDILTIEEYDGFKVIEYQKKVTLCD